MMSLRPWIDRAPLRRLAGPLADERGFTLSEMLTVMAILAIVLAGLTSVFVSSIRAEVDQNRRFQAQQEARLALDRLRREGHCASTISLPNATFVTLSFPAQCQVRGIGVLSPQAVSNALNNVTDPVTFTVSWSTGTPPTPPFYARVNNETLLVTAITGSPTPTSWTAWRAQLGSTAAAHTGTPTIQVAPYRVTWCTSGSGSRFALRRVEGIPAACTGGTVVANYLTQANVFPSCASASETTRARLGVNFEVSIDGSTRRYRLADNIVLRNAARATSAGCT